MKVKVGAYIFNNNNILLLKNLKGTWGIIGGELEDDDIEEALHREVKEETGLSIVIHSLFRYFRKGDEVVLLFHATTAQEEITLSHEHLDYKWTDPQHLDEFLLTYPEIKEDAEYLYTKTIGNNHENSY